MTFAPFTAAGTFLTFEGTAVEATFSAVRDPEWGLIIMIHPGEADEWCVGYVATSDDGGYVGINDEGRAIASDSSVKGVAEKLVASYISL